MEAYFASLAAAGGPWPLFVAFGVMFAQAFMLPVPAAVVTVAACALAGPLAGGAAAWAGAVCGASASFLLFRKLRGRMCCLGRIHRLIERASSSFRGRGFAPVFFARAAPCVPFGAVSVACGLSDMPFFPYAAATALGKILPTALYAWMGTNPLVLGIASAVFLCLLAVHLLLRRRKIRQRLS